MTDEQIIAVIATVLGCLRPNDERSDFSYIAAQYRANLKSTTPPVEPNQLTVEQCDELIRAQTKREST